MTSLVFRALPSSRALLLLAAVFCVGCAGAPVVSPGPPLAPFELAADVHQHLMMRVSLRPWFRGEPGVPPLGASQGEVLTNLVAPEQLRAAGIRVIIVALWPPPPRPGWTAMDEALEQLRELHHFVARHPEFHLARSPEEARALVRVGQLVLIPSLEGAEAIERLEDLDLLFSAGARALTLVHFVDNAVADAEDNQFGPVLGALINGKPQALTPLGRAVVERMFQLGMLVDLTHQSARAKEAVLQLAEARGVPVIGSHEGPGIDDVRTLPDAMARRIGKLGGVIGIGLFRTFQGTPRAERWAGFVPGSCDDVVANWVHYARLAGPDAVTLGSDLNSPILRPTPGGLCPTGVRNAGDLRPLLEAVISHGVPRQSVARGGLRVIEAWERVWRKSDPTVQHQARSRRRARPEPFIPPL